MTSINKKSKARAHEQRADVSYYKRKGRILILCPDVSQFQPQKTSVERKDIAA